MRPILREKRRFGLSGEFSGTTDTQSYRVESPPSQKILNEFERAQTDHNRGRISVCLCIGLLGRSRKIRRKRTKRVKSLMLQRQTQGAFLVLFCFSSLALIPLAEQ